MSNLSFRINVYSGGFLIYVSSYSPCWLAGIAVCQVLNVGGTAEERDENPGVGGVGWWSSLLPRGYF